MTFLRFIAGIVVILVVSVVLLITGHPNAAWVLSNPGLLLYMTLAMVLVAVTDPKKKWPGTHWTERLANLITFRR